MPKISELPVITSPDSADELPIVDTSTSSTKKMTLTKLKEWLQSLVGWVNTDAIADGAVTNNKLATGAGQPGGAWTSWTPTLENLSGGTLTYAKYTQLGKNVHFRILYTLGGAGVSSGSLFTLPVAMASGSVPSGTFPLGLSMYIDANGSWFNGRCTSNGSQIFIGVITSTGALSNINPTTPFTWATGDRIYATAYYESE